MNFPPSCANSNVCSIIIILYYDDDDDDDDDRVSKSSPTGHGYPNINGFPLAIKRKTMPYNIIMYILHIVNR